MKPYNVRIAVILYWAILLTDAKKLLLNFSMNKFWRLKIRIKLSHLHLFQTKQQH